jgi:DNA-binding GntR family transcriptional regulator
VASVRFNRSFPRLALAASTHINVFYSMPQLYCSIFLRRFAILSHSAATLRALVRYMSNESCAGKRGLDENDKVADFKGSREDQMEAMSCAHPKSNASEFLPAYEKLKLLVVTNQFNPNEHLQVSNLAEHLAVGVTPIREALIRLSVEDLITVHAKRGFFAKVLTVSELRALYHLSYSLLRAVLQWGGRRTDFRISAIDVTSGTQSDRTAALAFAVEQLHEQIAMVRGNAEMAKVIRNYNCRTHAVRLIYLGQFENLESSTDYVRTLTTRLPLNDQETIIERLQQHFNAKMARVPELIKEVTIQAFSADWTKHPLQSIDFARRRGFPVGIGQVQQYSRRGHV